MGVGAVYPASSTARKTSGERPRSLKLIRWRTFLFVVDVIHALYLGAAARKVNDFGLSSDRIAGRDRDLRATSRSMVKVMVNKPTLVLLPGPTVRCGIMARAGGGFGRYRRLTVADLTRDDRMTAMARRVLAEAPPTFCARRAVDGRLCRPGDHAPCARAGVRLALLDTSAWPIRQSRPRAAAASSSLPRKASFAASHRGCCRFFCIRAGSAMALDRSGDGHDRARRQGCFPPSAARDHGTSRQPAELSRDPMPDAGAVRPRGSTHAAPVARGDGDARSRRAARSRSRSAVISRPWSGPGKLACGCVNG